MWKRVHRFSQNKNYRVYNISETVYLWQGATKGKQDEAKQYNMTGSCEITDSHGDHCEIYALRYKAVWGSAMDVYRRFGET
jgi:hypothetical protein